MEFSSQLKRHLLEQHWISAAEILRSRWAGVRFPPSKPGQELNWETLMQSFSSDPGLLYKYGWVS